MNFMRQQVSVSLKSLSRSIFEKSLTSRSSLLQR